MKKFAFISAVTIMMFNNLIAIIIFMLEDFFEGVQTIKTIDMVITILFALEFIYNLITHKRPRYQAFVEFDTWVDLITIVTPILEQVMQGEGSD